MDIVLFDNNKRQKLYPLNNFCAVADLLTGAFTFKERWEKLTGKNIYVFTENYLEKLYPALPEGPALWIDAALLPDVDLFERIMQLDFDEALIDSNGLVAGKKTFTSKNFHSENVIKQFTTIYEYEARRFEYPFHLFEWNREVITFDFDRIFSKIEKPDLPASNQYLAEQNIFITGSAIVNFCTINASEGPVYIGKNALIMEGTHIRGPFVAREEAVLKMGTSIYGATTVGKKSTVGGEVKNSIIADYSNKGHHGYLGDSAIGKWCNLGAGTSNSNVKNNAGNISFWDNSSATFKMIGNKCGMIMGDFSRTAINSSINTGSVIGSCANVFGAGLMPKYIPDFQWDPTLQEKYRFTKAWEDLTAWMKMKAKIPEPELASVMKHIFELSQ